MTAGDRELGMARDITRRNFLHGFAGGVAASALLASSGSGHAETVRHANIGFGRRDVPQSTAYPPIRAGLRGSHEGSYQVAHALAHDGKTDWGTPADPDTETYDLVVVGGGISGLSAAFFYREQHPSARILVLENHDDFGGHAKRNEFQVGDRAILGYGGSQSLDGPGDYSKVMKRLLKKLAVDTRKFDRTYYDNDFFRRHGLTDNVFFDKKTYGVDRVVPFPLADTSLFLPTTPVTGGLTEAIAKMPISDEARRQMIRLNTLTEDRLEDHGLWSESGYLENISYLNFLKNDLGISNEEVLSIYRDVPAPNMASGIDAVSAQECLAFGMPGLKATSTGLFGGLIRQVIDWSAEPYIYHFPDGNASIARLLVRSLVPQCTAGNTMEDIVTAQFDYGKLDLAGAAARIRLDSTVINVEHEGSTASGDVKIDYIRKGKHERVSARNCVLACYGMMIPHLCPTLPENQRAALSTQIKAPLVYTNVLLNNWQAVVKQKIGIAHCPGSWHQLALTDFPVSMGEYNFANTPDQPIMMCLEHIPTAPGLPPREQYQIGRNELLTTDFETIERHVRTHMAGMLGPGGLDPAEDILGITVNRHAHGYAYGYNDLFDPDYEEGKAPHEIGRQKFGNITIANSDAGASAYVDAAVDQAWRAVNELEN
jgi:spermidine dehydrogenase